jgi:hypothetical protein
MFEGISRYMPRNKNKFLSTRMKELCQGFGRGRLFSRLTNSVMLGFIYHECPKSAEICAVCSILVDKVTHFTLVFHLC